MSAAYLYRPPRASTYSQLCPFIDMCLTELSVTSDKSVCFTITMHSSIKHSYRIQCSQ